MNRFSPRTLTQDKQRRRIAMTGLTIAIACVLLLANPVRANTEQSAAERFAHAYAMQVSAHATLVACPDVLVFEGYFVSCFRHDIWVSEVRYQLEVFMRENADWMEWFSPWTELETGKTISRAFLFLDSRAADASNTLGGPGVFSVIELSPMSHLVVITTPR